MKNLVLLYLLWWVVPTLGLAYLPVPESAGSVQRSFATFFFIALYVLLASNLTYRTIILVFRTKADKLYLYGAAVFGFFLVLYFVAAFWGQSRLLSALSTANLLGGAALAGAALSTAVKRIGELLPICIIAATADIMSVMGGPSRIMADDIAVYYTSGMEGAPPFIDHIIIKAGLPGFTIPVPLFGVTDWILVALLSSSLLRLNTSDNLLSKTGSTGKHLFLPVSACALYAAIVVAQTTGVFVPAMLFISLIFLLYLFADFKLHRELRKSDLLYSILFPAAIVLLLFLYSG